MIDKHMLLGPNFKRIDWRKYQAEVDKLEAEGCTTSDAQAIVDAQILQDPTPFLIPHDTRLTKAQQNALGCLHRLLDTLKFPAVLRHDFRWLFRWLHRDNSQHPNYTKTMHILRIFVPTETDGPKLEPLKLEPRQDWRLPD